MYEKTLRKRLYNLGVSRLILSWDTFVGVIVLFIVYILTDGGIPEAAGRDMLGTIITVSGSIFTIVLAGLALVTSFTDKLFIYAWKEIGEYDNLITTFQYNLFIPLGLILIATILDFIYYSAFAMIVLIALFAYMIVSLVDLVNFITKYGLQRGEFIRQEFENRPPPEVENVTEEELENILGRINDISEKLDDSGGEN